MDEINETQPHTNSDAVIGRFAPLPYPLNEYPDLGKDALPPDQERDQRHIKALGQAMVQRYIARGGNPGNLDLIYWLHDAEARHNGDAIQRWVRRMLIGAPPMSFEDKILFIERLLSEMLEDAV